MPSRAKRQQKKNRKQGNKSKKSQMARRPGQSLISYSVEQIRARRTDQERKSTSSKQAGAASFFLRQSHHEMQCAAPRSTHQDSSLHSYRAGSSCGEQARQVTGSYTTIRHEQLAIKGIPIAAATATISPPGATRPHGGHVVPGLDGPADEQDSGPDEIFSLSSAERSQSSSSLNDVESRQSDSSALTPDEWSRSEGEDQVNVALVALESESPNRMSVPPHMYAKLRPTCN